MSCDRFELSDFSKNKTQAILLSLDRERKRDMDEHSISYIGHFGAYG